MKTLKRLARCRRGTTAVEYGLLSSMLALGLLLGVGEAARSLDRSLEQLASAFDQAFAPGTGTHIDPSRCEAGESTPGACR
ncbi:Flp family type IVb pilin [Chthonobacter albigriseus]|uniref:Flp family type IVb pilin n=1 Tax=Chthonobacter albigriseus TaxID=1683161 RepID=UPI0015EEE882|nr:Flp family type IVb pilin [Chthonobacter albigriseus]